MANGKGIPKVYFLGAMNESLIKIGWTSDPFTKRRKSIENDQSLHLDKCGGLKFLAGVRGSRSDEQALHKTFAEFRHGKEWYTPARELVEYIRWLTSKWYVVTDEQTELPETGGTFDEWGPGPGKKRPKPPPSLFDDEPWATLRKPELTADDFYTSERIIKAVRSVMGEIDLDPASHPEANRTVGARHFFDNADNGLLRPWRGRVWLNPPFSQWAEWAIKIRNEWASGSVDEMCVLAATRTLTAKQFQPVMTSAVGLCITSGRIPFNGPRATSSPDDGHAIFYFGKNWNRFAEVMADLGTVFKRHDTP